MLIFSKIWRIEYVLKANLAHADPVIQDMARKMKEKFDKYWNDYSDVLAMAAILDPRFKLEVLHFSYNILDHSTCHEKVNNIKFKLFELYAEYENEHKHSTLGGQASCSSSPTSPIIDIGDAKDPGDQPFDYDQQAMNVSFYFACHMSYIFFLITMFKN